MKQKKRLMIWRGSGLAPIPPTPFPNVYSLEWDGVDDYVDLHTVTNLGTVNTISFWIKRNTIARQEMIFASVYASNYVLFFDGYNEKIHYKGYGGVNFTNAATVTAMQRTDWMHVLITRNASSCTLYIDGVFTETATGISADSAFGRIGMNFTGTLRPLDGFLDEISLFDTVLSADDIALISAAPIDLKTALSVTPEVWYRMGDSGTFFAGEWDIPDQMKIDNWSSYSMEFDGVDDTISLGNNSVFDFSGGIISISAWVNFNALSNYDGIVGKRHLSISHPICYMLSLDNTSKIRWLITQSDTVQKSIISNSTVSTGQWYHILVIADGTNIKMYLDGTLQTDTDTYDGTIDTDAADLFIGRNANDYMDGKFDDVSIFNTALSSGDVTTIYNSGEPTDLSAESGLVAYYRMGESAVFNANTEWEIPNYKKINYFSNLSMNFDGVDDYVDCGAITELSNASAFSISCWAKFDDIDSNDNLMWCTIKDANEKIRFWNYGGDIFLTMATSAADSVGNFPMGSAEGYANDTWYHLVVVFDGSGAANADRAKFYLDGVNKTLTFTGTIPATTFTNDGTKPFTFAKDIYQYPTYLLPGSLDDVSIYNSAKSASEVSAIYNSGIPKDESATANLQGYWRMGEGGYWNATNWQLPDYSKQALFSQKSFEFDGVDDVVNVPALGISGADARTMCCWFKTSSSSNQNIMGFGATSNGNYFALALYNSGGFKIFGHTWNLGAGGDLLGPVVTLNEWHFAALVYDGVTLKISLDGSSFATTSATLNTTDTVFTIGDAAYGSGTWLNLNGNIDDVSIYNVAKSEADIEDIYNSGLPIDLSAESGLVGYWTFDDATFDTNWTVPDNSSNSNTGTSANMDQVDLQFITPTNPSRGLSSGMDAADVINQAPENMEQGLSVAMDEADKINNAPDNTAQGRSVNMDEVDRVTDVPA